MKLFKILFHVVIMLTILAKGGCIPDGCNNETSTNNPLPFRAGFSLQQSSCTGEFLRVSIPPAERKGIFYDLQISNMDKITVGDRIPEFTLPDQNGKLLDIKTLLGIKNLVIFFYPKDDSPGCTREACYFRDQYEAFLEMDAEVIGISGQSVESHRKFALKHNLSYTLLSDKGNKIRKRFGVPDDLFGLIPGRVTYVVNKSGLVIYTFDSQMQVIKHVDEALNILEQLE